MAIRSKFAGRETLKGEGAGADDGGGAGQGRGEARGRLKNNLGDGGKVGGKKGQEGFANIQNLSRITAVAVTIAIIAAAYGIFATVSSNEKSKLLDAATTNVVIAGEQIKEGTLIESSMLEVATVSANDVPDGAVKDIGEVAGKTSLSYLPAGGMIVKQNLSGSEADRLAGRIAEDKVAVTITTNQQTGLAGLIHQGDHVTVVGNASANSDGEAVELATHAKVLALNADLDGYNSEYTAVTVEASPEDAENISIMSAGGAVSFIMEPTVSATSTSTGIPQKRS